MSSTSMPHQQTIADTSAANGSVAVAGNVVNIIAHTHVFHSCPYTCLVKVSSSSSKLILHLANVPHAPPKPVFTVDFRQDLDFVDRDDLLSQVDRICSRTAGRAALVGLGGVGKSQLAIEYAHRVRERSPEKSVFWVHAGTQARFEEGYRTIAEEAKIPGWDNPQENVLRLVWRWLRDDSNGSWVMIVDNADDSDVFFGPDTGHHTHLPDRRDQPVRRLSELLPQSSHGSFLITSRCKNTALRLTGRPADIIQVGPMDETQAVTLFGKKLQESFEERDAIALAKALDFMPLAIIQAAAFIQKAPQVTLSRYVQDLRKGDADTANLLDIDDGDMRRDGEASNSIFATWQISFEHIHKERPSATSLLSLMSLFDRQGIPESLLKGRYRTDNTSSDEHSSDFTDDLSMLSSFSLIKANVDVSHFEMHRLVQLSTKRWLEFKTELKEWKEKYIMLIDETYPIGRYENWTVCQAFYPHAQMVLEYRPNDAHLLERWASILYKAAWYAREMGHYQAAWEMDVSAMEARKATLGAEHPDTLTSMSSLALVLQAQGKYDDAEAMNRQALEGRERALGPDHPDTLTSMSNLAMVLRKQGKHREVEAEAMNRRALSGREKALGLNHPDTLTSVNNLAMILQRREDYSEAEKINRRALTGRVNQLGLNHPDTLTSLNSLAVVLLKQEMYPEAEKLSRQVLTERENQLRPTHPSTLRSLSTLAMVLQNQQRFSDAEEMKRQLLRSYEGELGPDHADTLKSVNSLARLLLIVRQYDEAASLFARAAPGFEEVFGKFHKRTTNCRANLDACLLALSQENSLGEDRGQSSHQNDIISVAGVASLTALGKPTQWSWKGFHYFVSLKYTKPPTVVSRGYRYCTRLCSSLMSFIFSFFPLPLYGKEMSEKRG